MKRRAFVAWFWLLLGFVSATIASLALFADIRILGYGQALYAVGCGVAARFYYREPERMNLSRPDESVPRGWVELSKILSVVVVVSALVLLLANN